MAWLRHVPCAMQIWLGQSTDPAQFQEPMISGSCECVERVRRAACNLLLRSWGLDWTRSAVRARPPSAWLIAANHLARYSAERYRRGSAPCAAEGPHLRAPPHAVMKWQRE